MTVVVVSYAMRVIAVFVATYAISNGAFSSSKDCF